MEPLETWKHLAEYSVNTTDGVSYVIIIREPTLCGIFFQLKSTYLLTVTDKSSPPLVELMLTTYRAKSR